MKFFFFLLGFIFLLSLSAQEQDFLDWDIDKIFDEIFEEEHLEEAETSTSVTTVERLLRQRGFTFDASYRFAAGFSNGWFESPFVSQTENDFYIRDYYLEYIIAMSNSFTVDAQFSEVFRAISTIYFQIPSFSISLGDFFFDYIFYKTVFIRAGKYNHSWGNSPNFGFTNLLARVPVNSYGGDSFILKADVPVGIGGVQILTLTRANLLGGAIPKTADFGFGAKYNLALRIADFNTGVFYQDDMPIRGFLSIKTTFKKTELFNEWLLAIDTNQQYKTSFATSIGFARDFFNNKLSVNGELFFNTEGDAYWYRPESWLQDSEVLPLVESLNTALNFLYRFGGKNNPRLFVQTRYALSQNSALVIPGFSMNLLPNLDLYFSAPMALGSKDGHYYLNTVHFGENNRPLPFSVVMLLSLSGSVQFGHYY